MDENDCGGVTFTSGFDGYVYELRRSITPEQSPNPSEESWLRPSKYNPPISCPEKASPMVTSCMGDSGGPLIMKGFSRLQTTQYSKTEVLNFYLDENGEHILIGNTSWGTGDCSDGYPGMVFFFIEAF